MLPFPDYEHYDALGLAALVRAGEATPGELLEAAIARTEARNPALNAVIVPLYEQARTLTRGDLPDGPFRGVPFLMKDLISAVAGTPLSQGCKALVGRISDHDAELTRRFKQTGAVIFGKTNCPEFGLMGTTEPEAWGPTRNPWNLAHSPGGSSGGTAAAVAAGLVPMAHAGDGGGSIRIPSAACGLFGFKPSRGRVPTGPDEGEPWQGATVEHVISRSVRDSAAMLDVLAPPETGAPLLLPPPPGRYLDAVGQTPGRLRIGFCTASPLSGTVHPDYVQAVSAMAGLLSEFGHVVEPVAQPYSGELLVNCYLTMYFGEVAGLLRRLEGWLGRKVRRQDVELATWQIAQLGERYSAGEFALARNRWHELCRSLGQFHTRYDLLLTPTLAQPPARLGELLPTPWERAQILIADSLHLHGLIRRLGLVEQVAARQLERLPFTQLANLTGVPAMSVPFGVDRDGLPIGLHFTARFAEEHVLFALAGQLEQARPWFDRRPVFAA